MKIWHISDTHTYHGFLKIPKDIDMVIFSGDCSNPRDPYINEQEVRNFLTWFDSLQIKHKVMIAGNHDTSIEKGLVDKETIEDLGIHYLFNESITIEGIKIWGSPHTPQFGNWAFMKSRGKLSRVWDSIPEDTNIIVVHGPPKHSLDLSEDKLGNLEMCGCSALNKTINRLKTCSDSLTHVMFGHIHNGYRGSTFNQGVLTRDGVTYSNASCTTDGRFEEGPTSNGNIFNYS